MRKFLEIHATNVHVSEALHECVNCSQCSERGLLVKYFSSQTREPTGVKQCRERFISKTISKPRDAKSLTFSPTLATKQVGAHFPCVKSVVFHIYSLGSTCLKLSNVSYSLYTVHERPRELRKLPKCVETKLF